MNDSQVDDPLSKQLHGKKKRLAWNGWSWKFELSDICVGVLWERDSNGLRVYIFIAPMLPICLEWMEIDQ